MQSWRLRTECDSGLEAVLAVRGQVKSLANKQHLNGHAIWQSMFVLDLFALQPAQGL